MAAASTDPTRMTASADAPTPAASDTVSTVDTALAPAEKPGSAASIAVEKRSTQASRTPASPTGRVRVRVDATARATYLCVDDGQGHQLFTGTLTGKKTFLARHLRFNVGLASTRITVNGKRVTLSGSPTGLDVTHHRGVRLLPNGQRPCAGAAGSATSSTARSRISSTRRSTAAESHPQAAAEPSAAGFDSGA
jgi:hypothetical protein